MNTNADGSWSTLKGLQPRRRGRDQAWASSWCAPELKPPSGPSCATTDALCVLVALSVTQPDQYTQRPAASTPAGVPVLTAALGDYPRRRHAALVHMSFVYNAYDRLPAALALVIDHGDAHVTARSDVCAQAIHLADIARLAKGLRGQRLFKSLTVDLAPAGTGGDDRGGGSHGSGGHGGSGGHDAGTGSDAGGSTGGNATTAARATAVHRFHCGPHKLSAAERAAWTALLSADLGPAPRTLWSYAGRGEFLGTREALRSLPRSTYATLLATLLSRDSPHANALASLMPRLWGALLGVAFTRAHGFVCDHRHGWGTPRGATRREVPSAVTRSAPLAALRLLSASPHATPAAAATALSRAPLKPSRRERATGCHRGVLACVIVAAHREKLKWLRELRYPTLVYHRASSPTQLYVTPNVYHEHAGAGSHRLNPNGIRGACHPNATPPPWNNCPYGIDRAA